MAIVGERSLMQFLSNLIAEIEAIKSACNHGCGQSYELYEERVQGSLTKLLERTPIPLRATTEAVLKEHGYDPHYEPFDAGPGECLTTGINENCCPCGRHP